MSEPKITNKRTAIFLVALLSGLTMVADGQGWVRIGPEPAPAPTPGPEPAPTPVPPNPNPTPIPVPPKPDPEPAPKPTPPDEVFPVVPDDLQAVSTPVKNCLTSADDALIYARAYKAFAREVARDDSVTSNDRFRNLHIAILKALIKESPGMESRNIGLGKAIDDVVAASQISPNNPDGLSPQQWAAEQRLRCSKAFEAVSGQAFAAYQSLVKPTSGIDFTKETLVCTATTLLHRNTSSDSIQPMTLLATTPRTSLSSTTQLLTPATPANGVSSMKLISTSSKLSSMTKNYLPTILQRFWNPFANYCQHPSACLCSTG